MMTSEGNRRTKTSFVGEKTHPLEDLARKSGWVTFGYRPLAFFFSAEKAFVLAKKG